jgi:hypothetical protein
MNPISPDPPFRPGTLPDMGARAGLLGPAPERAAPRLPENPVLWEELGYFTEEQLQALLDCLEYLE